MKILMLEKRNSINFYVFKITVDTFYRNKHFSNHKRGEHYFHMLAELNKMVFSAAPYIRQD